MNRILVSAAILALLSGPALAADLPTHKAAPMAPAIPLPYNWTGFYGGLNASWAWANNSYNSFRSTNGAFLGSGNDNSNGFHGGGQFGYRYEFPNYVVIGASASFDLGEDIKSSATSRLSSSTTDTTSNVGGDIVATAGYALGDVLPYVLGGFTWSNADIARTQLTGNGAPPSYTDTTSATRTGWTVGGGVAYHVWAGWEVFAQYRYSDYGSTNVTYDLAKLRVDSSVTSNSASIGVNYKF